MHYDGNFRDTSRPLPFRLLEIPSQFLQWTLVPIFRHTGSGAKILFYHEIEETRFREHIKYLQKYYNIVHIQKIIKRINRNEPVPHNYLAIGFDDGRRTIYSDAFPVVKEFNIPISIYLVTDAIKEGIYFWDKVDALQEVGDSIGSVDELATMNPEKRDQILEESIADHDISFERTALNWEEIIEMDDAGVDFQCHTKTHPSLPALKQEIIEKEIIESTSEIKRRLDTKITHFSYPFGHSSDAVIKLLQKHEFESAVGVKTGTNTNETDIHALRRVGVESTKVPLLASLIEGIWHRIVPGKTFRDGK